MPASFMEVLWSMSQIQMLGQFRMRYLTKSYQNIVLILQVALILVLLQYMLD